MKALLRDQSMAVGFQTMLLSASKTNLSLSEKSESPLLRLFCTASSNAKSTLYHFLL